MSIPILLATLLSIANAAITISFRCPPEGFNSVQNFNSKDYFSGDWYPVKQVVNSYQPEDSLYCVAATYTMVTTPKCSLLGCDDKQVDVYNRAKRGSVTGETRGGNLVGVIPNADDSSKALVGPKFVPQLFYGDYWVVAVGKYSDLVSGTTLSSGKFYDWAIITGGLPRAETSPGKCLPGIGFQNEGLWLFSRKAEPGADIVDEIVKKAADLKLDTSKLINVKHSGCTY